MRSLFLCGSIIFAFTATWASPSPFSHALLDRILQTNVDEQGLVDYASLKKSRTDLDSYIDSLAAFSPRSHPDRFPNRQHELAYWINAYNAFVLRGVVDAYPVASVMDIKILNGFFRRLQFTAGGQELTLDEIENKIIRPVYQDPRIHFVINCGAVSCPELENRAFTGKDLDIRLQKALQRFAANPGHVHLNTLDNKLHLSKILDWFGQDFINWFPQNRDPVPANPTLVDYLLFYLPGETATYLRQHADVEISYDKYDWALNEQHKK